MVTKIHALLRSFNAAYFLANWCLFLQLNRQLRLADLQGTFFILDLGSGFAFFVLLVENFLTPCYLTCGDHGV
jgi:hypothetical protein